MDYKEALEYITTIQARLGSDYSLAEVTELSRRFDRPERKIKVIHIAGTNGKGSVGNYISNILAEAGYRVGRYISPTIFDYRERIQKVEKKEKGIACSYISKEDVAELLTDIRRECRFMEQEGFAQPTAFEIETIMAFLKFCQWEVDVAVVETGMGGRLDATNIVENPVMCVFTSISRDHMKFLGDSIEKIAEEKYGIIKEGSCVVSQKQQKCEKILEECCHQKHAILAYMQAETITVYKTEIEETIFYYRGTEYKMRQAGSYQVENAALAIEAVLQLQKQGEFLISQEHIRRGLFNSRWKGRFDVVSKEPFVLADGAHNEEAAKRLCDSLKKYFPKEKFQFVMGVFEDKEYEKVIGCLLPLTKRIYTVTAPGKRGLPSKSLCKCVRRMLGREEGLTQSREELLRDDKKLQRDGQKTLFDRKELTLEEVYSCETVKEALGQAICRDSDTKIIVCGSLSIVGDVYRYFSLY